MTKSRLKQIFFLFLIVSIFSYAITLRTGYVFQKSIKTFPANKAYKTHLIKGEYLFYKQINDTKESSNVNLDFIVNHIEDGKTIEIKATNKQDSKVESKVRTKIKYNNDPYENIGVVNIKSDANYLFSSTVKNTNKFAFQNINESNTDNMVLSYMISTVLFIISFILGIFFLLKKSEQPKSS